MTMKMKQNKSTFLIALFALISVSVASAGEMQVEIQRECSRIASEIAARYGNPEFAILVTNSDQLGQNMADAIPYIEKGISLKEKVSEQEILIAQNDNKITEQANAITANEQKIASNTAAITTLDTDFIAVRGKLEAEQVKIEQANTTIAEQSDTIAGNMNKIAEQENEIAAYRKQIEVFSEKIKTLEKDYLVAQTRVGDEQRRVDLLRETVARITSRYEQAARGYEQAAQGMSEVQAMIGSLSLENVALVAETQPSDPVAQSNNVPEKLAMDLSVAAPVSDQGSSAFPKVFILGKTARSNASGVN